MENHFCGNQKIKNHKTEQDFATKCHLIYLKETTKKQDEGTTKINFI